jgi:thiol-disulfide isomerase/thioredoxin
MELEKGKVHAPEIGTEWVNSAPLTLASLRGRVVLVDFWDYTCVNCIRTLPYVVEWHRRYRDMGLAIVGVHAPEFSFARTKDFVAAAIKRLGIEYPVVMDNGYMIWQAFANKCWPAKYLIDKNGYMRFFHFGEGDYKGTEEAIQTLLREVNPALVFDPPMEPLRDTDRAGAVCYRATPELYLGNRRGSIGNAGGFLLKDQPVAAGYSLPAKLEADVFYLSGPWRSGPESASSAATDGAPSALLVYYTAKEVNLVIAPADSGAHTVELLQDGKPLAREDAGEDVRYTPSGESIVPVDTPRMYSLVRNTDIGQHLLQLVTHEAGVECFAFTFVSCVAQYE